MDPFGVEGLDFPFDPANVCCNAPNPPGALGNTCICGKKTKYFRQTWTCVWTQTPLKCAEDDCAWTKAWRCNFYEVDRCDVCRHFCKRGPARCPEKGACYTGECECTVPEDQFFAQVWDSTYEFCPKDGPVDPASCHERDAEGNPAGCACCGVFEKCKARLIKLNCKKDIPSKEESCSCCAPACREANCQSTGCKVKTSASPNFWLTPAALY